MPSVIQTSFSAGELSPNLYAHVDLAKYHVGLALARNFFVDYRGGVSTRTGSRFVCQVRDTVSAHDVRLIPFQFSVIQTYILEFGDQYIRFIKDGEQITEAAKTIDAISNSSPGVVTVNGHGYGTGNWVFFEVDGMNFINGLTAIVIVTGINTFTLLNPITGNPIDTTSMGTFVSGTAAKIYEITSPYLAEDLFDLKFVQNADVLTITHPDYAPRNLTRTGHTSWTLTPITFGSSMGAPTIVSVVASAAGTVDYKYVVTAVDATGQESVASNIGDCPGAVNIATTAGSITVNFLGVLGAVSYNVYKAQPAVNATVPSGVNYGFIGSLTGGTFVDSNIVPDFTSTPPLNTNPFSGNNPGTVGYFQQRRVFGGSITYPETLWFSQPGNFDNFDVTNPVADDNAITATLISNQVNNIKHMVAMPGGLIVLTGGGAWQVSGGSADAPITPRSVTATPQAYNGCSDVPPIVINYDILYNQARGTVVRDLSYSFYTNIYTGADISVLSNHLLIGRSIVDWTYAEDPFKVVWSVTSDGDLLSLTYLKEQEVIGWAHSDTLGEYKSVASVPEGQTNAVYVIVQRLIEGHWVKFIERFAERTFPYGAEDAFNVDAGLANNLTYPAAGLSVDVYTGAATFTADAAVFNAGQVGSVLRVGGGIATITAFDSTTQLRGTFTRSMTDTIPNSSPPVPLPAVEGEWSLTAPSDQFWGLQHLVGQTVAILGDGNVFPNQVVAVDGSVTLSQPVTKVAVGLPFQAQMQTLYLDLGTSDSVQGKFKKVSGLTTRVHETRGLKMGSDFDHLVEYKMRASQPYGQPIDLQTGDQWIIMDPSWNIYGQICIQQDYPLPATVLGVVPVVTVGS